MIPGLEGDKMSASIVGSKIDLLDDEKTVSDKVRSAYCREGEIAGNAILAFLKYVIMVLKKDKREKLIVRRDKRFGGDLEFSNYEDVEKLFINKELHPLDLKNAVAFEINCLLKPIRKNINELKKLSRVAYA